MFGFLERAQRPVSTLPLALIVGCSLRIHSEQLLLVADAFAVAGYRVKPNATLRSIALDNLPALCTWVCVYRVPVSTRLRAFTALSPAVCSRGLEAFGARLDSRCAVHPSLPCPVSVALVFLCLNAHGNYDMSNDSVMSTRL